MGWFFSILIICIRDGDCCRHCSKHISAAGFQTRYLHELTNCWQSDWPRYCCIVYIFVEQHDVDWRSITVSDNITVMS